MLSQIILLISILLFHVIFQTLTVLLGSDHVPSFTGAFAVNFQFLIGMFICSCNLLPTCLSSYRLYPLVYLSLSPIRLWLCRARTIFLVFFLTPNKFPGITKKTQFFCMDKYMNSSHRGIPSHSVKLSKMTEKKKTRCNLLANGNKSNLTRAAIFWSRTIDNKSRNICY